MRYEKRKVLECLMRFKLSNLEELKASRTFNAQLSSVSRRNKASANARPRGAQRSFDSVCGVLHKLLDCLPNFPWKFVGKLLFDMGFALSRLPRRALAVASAFLIWDDCVWLCWHYHGMREGGRGRMS